MALTVGVFGAIGPGFCFDDAIGTRSIVSFSPAGGASGITPIIRRTRYNRTLCPE